MKTVSAAIAFCTMLLVNSAGAQTSCQSLTSNVIRVSGQVLTKAGEILEMAGRKLGPYVVTAATGNPVFSNSDQARRAISDFAGDAIAKQMEIFSAIGQLDGNGSGTIGARSVYIPTQRVTGELWTERTFIGAPSSYHKVTVKIKKLDGKAGARIAVCAKYADGTEYNVLNRNEFTDGDDNIGVEKTWVLNNMQDKYVTIHLVHTGIVTNKFNYELSIEGEHDPAKLPRQQSNNENNSGNNNEKNDKPKDNVITPQVNTPAGVNIPITTKQGPAVTVTTGANNTQVADSTKSNGKNGQGNKQQNNNGGNKKQN